MPPRAATILLTTTALAIASDAAAQEGYPYVVRDHLTLQTTPPCSLCHAKGNTGVGTVVTPFGWSMRGKGLVVDDSDSVVRALDALAAARTDSDGDGVGDIDELKAGTDPNTSARAPLGQAEDPQYGCVRSSLSDRRTTPAFSILLAMVLVGAGGYRRASRASQKR